MISRHQRFHQTSKASEPEEEAGRKKYIGFQNMKDLFLDKRDGYTWFAIFD